MEVVDAEAAAKSGTLDKGEREEEEESKKKNLRGFSHACLISPFFFFLWVIKQNELIPLSSPRQRRRGLGSVVDRNLWKMERAEESSQGAWQGRAAWCTACVQARARPVSRRLAAGYARPAWQGICNVCVGFVWFVPRVWQSGTAVSGRFSCWVVCVCVCVCVFCFCFCFFFFLFFFFCLFCFLFFALLFVPCTWQGALQCLSLSVFSSYFKRGDVCCDLSHWADSFFGLFLFFLARGPCLWDQSGLGKACCYVCLCYGSCLVPFFTRPFLFLFLFFFFTFFNIRITPQGPTWPQTWGRSSRCWHRW